MPVHTEAGDRWRARLVRPDGTLSPRVNDAEVERAFWRQRAQRGLFAQDDYAGRVWDALWRECAGRDIHTVLEIGPGWGNYTFPLLRHFDAVTALDISPDNLAALRDKADEVGFHLDTLCAAWEEARPPRHDLVFGYNCFYRVTEPELFFQKIDASARKMCAVGMNRPPELPWLRDMDEAGLRVHYTRQGCEAISDVLASLGIRARMIDIPNVRTYTYADEGALLKRARSFLLEDAPDDLLLGLLMPYHRRLSDGRLVNEYHFTSQLLVWQPAHGTNPDR